MRYIYVINLLAHLLAFLYFWEIKIWKIKIFYIFQLQQIINLIDLW